jgi:hypothetical protein
LESKKPMKIAETKKTFFLASLRSLVPFCTMKMLGTVRAETVCAVPKLVAASHADFHISPNGSAAVNALRLVRWKGAIAVCTEKLRPFVTT